MNKEYVENIVKRSYVSCLLNNVTDKKDMVEYIEDNIDGEFVKEEVEKLIDKLINDDSELTEKAQKYIERKVNRINREGYCDTETIRYIIEDMLESNMIVNINKAIDLFYELCD